MEEYIAHGFEDLPAQIEFHEKLKSQVEKVREKLNDALIKAEKIPTPGNLPQPTEEERLEMIREVLKRSELSRSEAKKEDVVKVRLYETPTIFLFEIVPRGYAEGTEQAEKILQQNKTFEEAKERTSGMRYKESFTQTVPSHLYKEVLLTEPILKEDKGCIASEWLLHDAMNEEVLEIEKRSASIGEDSELLDDDYHEPGSLDLEKHQRFQHAVMITCRVLSSNTFAKEQIVFCKKHLPSRQMSYKMDLLWTFSGMEAGPVNSICLNPRNANVFGIGYGTREGAGRVMVWPAKNPEYPERVAVTERAVTRLQFSSTQPKLLAAVTRAGAVLLIDITGQPPIITHVNREEQPPFGEALWSVAWYSYSDGVSETERLLTIGQSGELWMWDPITKKENKKIASLSFITSPDPELIVGSQEVLGKSLEEEFPSDDIDPEQLFLEVPFIGLNMSLSPSDSSAVYITTDVGSIIKVNISKCGGEWEKIPGHRLSVFGLHHSPYLPAAFLTYAADGDVNIWIHGFDKPIITLRISDISLYGIDAAAWSPSHSSILASLSRERVCLWDISRRTDMPMSYVTGRHYTTLTFSDAGTNLLVGCKEGDVLVYRLSEMPHRPYMQKEHLERALRKAVEGKSELQKALDTYLKTDSL